jgi:hypothetical protein
MKYFVFLTTVSLTLSGTLLSCDKTYPPEKVGALISASAGLTTKSGSVSMGRGLITINTTFGQSPSILIFGNFEDLTSAAKKVVLKGPERTCEVTEFSDLSANSTSGRVNGNCDGPLTQTELDQLRREGNWSVVLMTAQSPDGELEGSLAMR